MFREIHIRDLGVIEEAELHLGPGLNVVTGETGAGKTMVVHGLTLLAGGRSDATVVRTGAAGAVVEGVVEVSADHPARQLAEAAGGHAEEDLLVSRSVGAQGRSRAHAGGRMVPVATLGEMGESLLAIHGQAGQWRLRQPEQHRVLLDAFGGRAVDGALERYRHCWDEVAAATADLERARRDAAGTRHLLAEAEQALAAIDAVEPEPDEDSRLAAEAERLGHVDALRQAVETARLALAGSDDDPAPGIVDAVAAARRAVAPVIRHDPGLQDLDRRIADLGYLATDLVVELGGYLAGVDDDPARLAWVQQRLADLTSLTRRFGPTLPDVLAYADRSRRLVLELDDSPQRLAELTRTAEQARIRLGSAASQLTAARRAAADRLAAAVTDELADLAMPRTRVVVDLASSADPTGLSLPDGTIVRAGPAGVDDVDIRLVDGAGPPRSITRAASGGELARIMLAIEVVTAAIDAPACLVFDEVDAGVGGEAGLAVGARLARLARHTQVVVVTHLAQVAAYADRHLVVSKRDDGSVVTSSVRAVDGPARWSELARMMGGDAEGAAGVDHARALLERTRPDPG